MAAPPTKVVIYYNYQARGFSETLWNTNSTDKIIDPAGGASPGLIINKYFAKRLPMMSNKCQAVYARASVVATPRVFDIMPLVGAGKDGQLTDRSSAPDDVILCKMFGATGQQGVMHLHAFPASILDANLLDNLGKFQGKLNDFADYMVNGGDGWVLNSSQPSTRPIKYNCSALVLPVTGRGFTIQSPMGGPAFPNTPPGTVISISGAGADQFGFNGRKIVQEQNVTAGTIRVGGAIPVGTPAATFQFFVVAPNSVPIKKFQPFELSERKTGKVFGVPVGRRRSTLSLRR